MAGRKVAGPMLSRWLDGILPSACVWFCFLVFLFVFLFCWNDGAEAASPEGAAICVGCIESALAKAQPVKILSELIEYGSKILAARSGVNRICCYTISADNTGSMYLEARLRRQRKDPSVQT